MAYLYLRGKEVYVGYTDRQGTKRQEPTLLPALENPKYRIVGDKRKISWPDKYRDWLRDFEYKLAHDNKGMGGALNADFSFEKLFKDFIASLPPGTPAKTTGGYETAKKHLVSLYPNPSMNFLTPARMVEFRNHLLSERERDGKKVKPLSTNSVLSYLNSLSAFFTWAKGRHYITEHPITKEVRIPEERREVPNFTDEQLKILLDRSVKMRNRDAPKGATPMYDILRFLLLSGFRITEATSLRWRDIHFDDGYIVVLSKDGKRHDLYPLNLELRTFLESLPRHFDPHVFLYRSKSHPGRWVRGVVKLLKWGRYRVPVNERDDPSQEGRLSIHTLRKNFGTYQARIGIPLHRLQELMRHRKITTTQGYYLRVKVDENRSELDRRESLLAHVERIKRSA